MANIFISHSSRDVKESEWIKKWLNEQGFHEVFLDIDKHGGLAPGAHWERDLYAAIDRSDAMIVIVTPNWLDSKWCFAEFTQARALGKAIFPIIVAPVGDRLISPDIQHLNLLESEQGGLERLSQELSRVAKSQFDWDTKRSPYPGLAAVQEEDAAIYFGRDEEIRKLIERLNARRVHGGKKLNPVARRLGRRQVLVVAGRYPAPAAA